MPKNPPNCYICEKNYENEVDKLYYCICDIAVCENCVNSIKKSNEVWICPHCNNEVEIEDSKLFRL